MLDLSRHLSFANVASALALAVALGTGTAYAANTVRSTDIVNGQVRTVDLGANAVTTAKIRASGVRNPDLGTGAVEGRVLRDDAVTADDLAADSVRASEIATNGVGASEIESNAIDGDEVVNGTLTSSDLAPSSVGTSEVVNNALTFSDLAGGGAVGNVSIPAGAVPNGRCEDYTISISGAAVGDAVVMTSTETLQNGVFWYATQVTAPGTARAMLCNLSGGAMAALTDHGVRVVTFR